MGLLDEMRIIERQQFFNGQRLFASDLQDLEAFNREMRWLHNRSLHQPGIGNGFAVTGEKGAREVLIGPGYALDALGREIVLIDDWIEPVPPVAGEADGSPAFFDLTVSYPADEALEVAETRAGVCAPRGVVRLQEEPVFCWVRLKMNEANQLVVENDALAKEIQDGMKIVLARAEVRQCQLNSVLSVAQRRSARPSKQPHVACGTFKPDPWQVEWLIDRQVVKDLLTALLERQFAAGSSAGTPIATFMNAFATTTDSAAATGAVGLAAGLQAGGVSLLGPIILPFAIRTTVDTSAAKFMTTPCYTAHVDGSQTKEFELPIETGQQPSLFTVFFGNAVG